MMGGDGPTVVAGACIRHCSSLGTVVALLCRFVRLWGEASLPDYQTTELSPLPKSRPLSKSDHSGALFGRETTRAAVRCQEVLSGGVGWGCVELWVGGAVLGVLFVTW